MFIKPIYLNFKDYIATLFVYTVSTSRDKMQRGSFCFCRLLTLTLWSNLSIIIDEVIKLINIIIKLLYTVIKYTVALSNMYNGAGITHFSFETIRKKVFRIMKFSQICPNI